MNLAIKELADTKFDVLLCCCQSILNLFPLTSTNTFLCDIESVKKLLHEFYACRPITEPAF